MVRRYWVGGGHRRGGDSAAGEGGSYITKGREGSIVFKRIKEMI